MAKGFKAVGKIKTKQWKGMKDGFTAMSGVDFSSFISFFTELATVKPILSILTALLKVWVTSIMIPLLPITRAIVQEMIKLIPLARAWGNIIGVMLIPTMTFSGELFIWWIGIWGLFAIEMTKAGDWMLATGLNVVLFAGALQGLFAIIAGVIARINEFIFVIETLKSVFGVGNGDDGHDEGPTIFDPWQLVPGLQGGGTVRGNLGGGTIARLGERGDETVVPSDQLDDLILETRRSRQDANFRNTFERRRRR